LALPLLSGPLQAKSQEFDHSIRPQKRPFSSPAWSAAKSALGPMFRLRRRTPAEITSRLNALRQLYLRFSAENTSEARALRLMRDWLSLDQREQFDKSAYIEVIGCDSRKRYRIYHGIPPPNIYEIDDAGGLMAALCFMPHGHLAAGDIMLAQKIALETDEHRALAVANRFSPDRDLIELIHSNRQPRGVWRWVAYICSS
jgi:hypothetical protein